jgi:hypothetical protein
VGVKRTSEVVLINLAFIQRPAIVLVLVDVKPRLALAGRQRAALL